MQDAAAELGTSATALAELVGDHLHLRLYAGCTPQDAADRTIVPETVPLPPFEAIRSGQTVVVPNLVEHQLRFPNPDLEENGTVGISRVCVPLRSPDADFVGAVVWTWYRDQVISDAFRRQCERHAAEVLQALETGRAVLRGRSAHTDSQVQQADLELARSEHRAMLRAFPDLYFRYDADLVFVGHVPGDRQPLRKPSEFLGRPAHEVLPPQIWEQVKAPMRAAITTGEIQACLYELDEGHGRGSRHFEARFVPLPNGECSAVIRDVTDNVRQSERLLLERRRATQLLAATLPTTTTTDPMVHALDVGANFLGCDVGIVARLGVGVQDDSGWQFDEHELDDDEAQVQHIGVLGTPIAPPRSLLEDSWERETYHWPVTIDPDGHADQPLPPATPVTIEVATSGHAALTDQQVQWCGIFGGARLDAAVRTFDDIHVICTNPTLGANVEIRAAINVPIIIQGVRYGLLQFQSSTTRRTPFTDGDRVFVRILAGWIASQIEARLRRERLTRALEQLADSNRLQRDFVAIASHELRTPVSVIGGVAEVLTTRWEQLNDDNRRQMLDAIGRQTRRLTRMAEDVLTVSEAERGLLSPEPGPVRCLQAIESAVAASNANAQAVIVGGVTDLAVQADPRHLQRVLVNLLDNATAYGSAPIEIDVVPAIDGVAIQVRDHGPGISDAFRPQLFAPFTQAENPDTRRAQGTGLGLAISDALVRAGAGRLDYRDAPGGGACFVVTLPAAVAQDELAVHQPR